jgi:signal transduction histidine kinase
VWQDGAVERLHPVTLAFVDDELEGRYVRDEGWAAKRDIRTGAWMIVLACLAMLVFPWLLDWPGRDGVMAMAGLALMVSVSAIVLARRFRGHVAQQVIGGGANTIAALGFFQVADYMGLAATHGLHANLVCALIAFFLLRLRFIAAAPFVATYTTVALVRVVMLAPKHPLGLDAFLVIVGVGVAGITARFLERARRKAFFRRERLSEAHAALKDAQAQLLQAEKMASLGKLVAGVAHDINTPLGAIASTQQTLDAAIAKLLRTLEKEHADALSSQRIRRTFDVLRDASGTIANGADRVNEVIRRLRSFARLDEATLQDIDLTGAIDDVLALLEHRLVDGVEVKNETGDLPTLRCYPAELNQLLLSLLTNALEAVGDVGNIVVRSRIVRDEVVIEVVDDGAGIDQAHLDEVFDPGFTTKGVGVGGGYGLSIAFRIAQDHGGVLTIDSERGKGTTVTLHLPLTGPPARAAVAQ